MLVYHFVVSLPYTCHVIFPIGGMEPSSSPGWEDLPPFQDETDMVLGNDADVPAEEEEEGEELFGENFEA